MYKIKIFLTSALAIFILQGFAQRSSSSPFSRFGYGLISDKSLSFGQGLSNTGIGLRPNNHLNFINPASFSAIDSSHFIFEVGVKNQFTTIEEGNNSATTSNSNMEYLAVGFPVARWWGMGFSLMPFTKVGYAFKSSSYLPDSTLISSYYTGIGGSNQLIWSNAISPIKGLSIGLNYAILFGTTTLESYNIIKTDYVVENAWIQKSVNMKGFYIEGGVQYEYLMNNNKSFIIGAIITPSQKLTSRQNLIVSNTDLSYTVEKAEGENVKSDYPMKIGIGLSYSKKDKFMTGIDYTTQDWTGTTIYGNEQPYLDRMNSFNAGMEYLPNKFSPTGYFNKVRYRFGIRYLKSNLSLPESTSNRTLYQVNEFSGSFGLGLPLKMSANNINLSFEIGSRKTNSNLLPKETFYVLNLNFTLNENWFYKRKIK